MSFGGDKCKTQSIRKDKRQIHGFQLEDIGTSEPMQEVDTSILVFNCVGLKPFLKHNKSLQQFIPEG
jgi:hypothetical protein